MLLRICAVPIFVSYPFASSFPRGQTQYIYYTPHHIIMRVSQAWKQVATSTKAVFDKKKHFRDLARTKIQLSGDQPLDVCINVSSDVKFTTSTANLLRKYVSRFRTLEIRVPKHETAETLVSSIGEGIAAPLLERLVIHVGREIFPIFL